MVRLEEIMQDGAAGLDIGLDADDFVQLVDYFGNTGSFYRDVPPVDANLGEVVTGEKEGRLSESDRIIDFNLGLASHDVIIADAVFRRAQSASIGTRLTLSAGHS